MLIRLGIPTSFRRLSAAAGALGAPILVSANAFRSSAGGFRKVSADLFSGCDVALDSAGFVAMVRYGGYPWTVAEYVWLAKSHPWAWWASMDYCCEPQVAADRAEVRRRVQETARQLHSCQEEAKRQAAPPCMPVLQGWAPDDYLACFDLMAGLELPDLLGLGSVCRRPLKGTTGLLSIVTVLDRYLPPRHRFHLFGAKGTAVGELAGHPRIQSVDSMAWDAAARREKGDAPFSLDLRMRHMESWYRANRALLSPAQMRLAV